MDIYTHQTHIIHTSYTHTHTHTHTHTRTNLDGVVGRTGRDTEAIGMEADVIDGASVIVKGPDTCTLVGIPEPHLDGYIHYILPTMHRSIISCQ